MNDRSTSTSRGRRRWTPVLASLGLLATVAVLAAGCGDDETGGGNMSAADREREQRQAALNYARCIREHGVDMPDPTFQAGGGSTQVGPDDPGDLKRPKFREAEQACRRHLEAVEPPQLSEEDQQEARDAGLANARCMREHGIENFPDPTFGENGESRIRIDRSSGIDPNDPDFREAQRACQPGAPEKPLAESKP